MELLKYNSLISNVIFLAVALGIAKQAPGYTFAGYTISKSLRFLQRKQSRIIFHLNFFVKSLLDLGFWWYLLSRNVFTFWSLVSVVMVCTFALFGVLGYVTEPKNHLLHRYIVSVIIAGCCLIEILLAQTTGSSGFFVLSLLVSATSFIYAMWFMLKERVNVYVQLISGASLFFWTLLYVVYFL